jgi:hypothetical protein
MDEARRDEIRGRLDRPHTRDALAPLVTASELRALLDALDAAEREHVTDCDLIARQSAILTAVADALKGTPPALSSHSHHDLGDVARRVVAALAAADGTAPITAPLREPSACERCGGRRAVAKMSGPIPCPACVPPVRVPCAYCVEGVALGTGETCRECDGGVR